MTNRAWLLPLTAALAACAQKSPEAAPEVRAAVFAQLARLRSELHARHAADSAGEAHLRLAERDLSDFLERPESRKPRAPKPPPPPGRPIGAKGSSR